MLYRIEDRVANTQKDWDTTSKVVKVTHFSQSVVDATEAKSKAVCGDVTMNALGGRASMMDLYGVIETLGAKTIAGVLTEGTRGSNTSPGAAVVHESWYSPELKIVILETNDDPRTGSTSDELIEIVRGEPVVTQYRPPADYVVRELQLPSSR